MNLLKLDLLNNAKDSLRHAVDILAWDDTPRSNKYKQAILSVFHCAELLLKERLQRVNGALVWENVDKFPSLDARTVTVQTALSRLERIGEVTISEEDQKKLLECLKLRNAIQHFEVKIEEKVARAMLGKVLSFVFDFAEKELKLDLRKEFTDDDTWAMLVAQFDEFANEHGPKVASKYFGAGALRADCPICGQDTVDMDNEHCVLCDITFPT